MTRYFLILVLGGMLTVPAFSQVRLYNTRLAAWERAEGLRFQHQWLNYHAARIRAERDGCISLREKKKLNRKKERIRRGIRYHSRPQVP